MSLKQKTISAMIWSFVDNFSLQGINFIVGIILARLLSPKEFGLVGLLAVFIAISQSFIDSGFSSALIRKKNSTEMDHNTVFYFNLALALIIYTILFFSSPYISNFFKEPQLETLVKVLSLNLIISSAFLIQNTILTKNINFKLKTKISIASTIFSGIIAIYMAYVDFGVWSLVAKSISASLLSCLLFWLYNGWRPALVFSIQSLRELFGFGSKLLISGLIDNIYQNINKLVVAKFYSTEDLGFYNNADQFKKLPAENLTSIVQRVSYPVLTELQNDNEKLKKAFIRLISTIMFLSFFMMFTMSAVSNSLIATVLGAKWEQSADLLFWLCFAGSLYPLHALNLNVLNVKGRSDLFLKLEIIKKIIAIPTIMIGVFYGVKALIIASIFQSVIAYFINSYYTVKLINYPVKEQLFDIMPAFLISVATAIPVWLLGFWLENYANLSQLIILIIQLTFSIIFFLILAELSKNKSYNEIKVILLARMHKK